MEVPNFLEVTHGPGNKYSHKRNTDGLLTYRRVFETTPSTSRGYEFDGDAFLIPREPAQYALTARERGRAAVFKTPKPHAATRFGDLSIDAIPTIRPHVVKEGLLRRDSMSDKPLQIYQKPPEYKWDNKPWLLPETVAAPPVAPIDLRFSPRDPTSSEFFYSSPFTPRTKNRLRRAPSNVFPSQSYSPHVHTSANTPPRLHAQPLNSRNLHFSKASPTDSEPAPPTVAAVSVAYSAALQFRRNFRHRRAPPPTAPSLTSTTLALHAVSRFVDVRALPLASCDDEEQDGDGGGFGRRSPRVLTVRSPATSPEEGDVRRPKTQGVARRRKKSANQLTSSRHVKTSNAMGRKGAHAAKAGNQGARTAAAARDDSPRKFGHTLAKLLAAKESPKKVSAEAGARDREKDVVPAAAALSVVVGSDSQGRVHSKSPTLSLPPSVKKKLKAVVDEGEKSVADAPSDRRRPSAAVQKLLRVIPAMRWLAPHMSTDRSVEDKGRRNSRNQMPELSVFGTLIMKREDLQDLLFATMFTQHELKLLLEAYSRFAGEEGLTKFQFSKCLPWEGPKLDLTQRLFQLFDTDSSGLLTPEKLARGVSRMVKGTVTSRLRFCFDFYDLDGSGLLDQRKIVTLCKSEHGDLYEDLELGKQVLQAIRGTHIVEEHIQWPMFQRALHTHPVFIEALVKMVPSIPLSFFGLQAATPTPAIALKEREAFPLDVEFDWSMLMSIWRYIRSQGEQEARKPMFPVILKTYLGFDDEFFAGRLFELMDADRSASVSFMEFVDGITVGTYGTFDEKVEFYFRLFDIDADGVLSEADMIIILKSRGHRDDVLEDLSYSILSRIADHTDSATAANMRAGDFLSALKQNPSFLKSFFDYAR